MAIKYKLYFTVTVLGIVVGIYIIYDMLTDWLELGELLRYMLIRIPLAIVVMFTVGALRRKYLVATDGNSLKPLTNYSLRFVLIGGVMITVLLLVPPNVYFWFI